MKRIELSDSDRFLLDLNDLLEKYKATIYENEGWEDYYYSVMMSVDGINIFEKGEIIDTNDNEFQYKIKQIQEKLDGGKNNDSTRSL